MYITCRLRVEYFLINCFMVFPNIVVFTLFLSVFLESSLGTAILSTWVLNHQFCWPWFLRFVKKSACARIWVWKNTTSQKIHFCFCAHPSFIFKRVWSSRFAIAFFWRFIAFYFYEDLAVKACVRFASSLYFILIFRAFGLRDLRLPCCVYSFYLYF